MESQATRRFSAEIAARSGMGDSVAGELDTAEVIAFLDYKTGLGIHVRNPRMCGVPFY